LVSDGGVYPISPRGDCGSRIAHQSDCHPKPSTDAALPTRCGQKAAVVVALGGRDSRGSFPRQPKRVGTALPEPVFHSSQPAQEQESNRPSPGTLDTASEVDRSKGCAPTTLVNQHNVALAKTPEVTERIGLDRLPEGHSERPPATG
jgi:hypothetical protein